MGGEEDGQRGYRLAFSEEADFQEVFRYRENFAGYQDFCNE
jgi:hypothetical protein